MTDRNLIFSLDGKTYEMPEAWAVGWTRSDARQYAVNRAWLRGEISTAEHDRCAAPADREIA